jgi:DNA adenine methylase
MEACFSFIGAKAMMADWIISRFPQHNSYVEVFGGSGAVLLKKQMSKKEVYNDFNENLTNFFEVIRSDTDAFIHHFDFLMHNEVLHNKFQREPLPKGNNLEWAIRYFYLIVNSFNGQVDASFNYTTHVTNKNTLAFKNKKRKLLNVARRFKNVEIRNRDFEHIIETYDNHDTLFYIDPPYYGKEDYYNHSAGELFNIDDHKRLRDTLEDIKGKALVSYYGTPEIMELYKDWQHDIYRATRHSLRHDKKLDENIENKVDEYMFSNFRLPIQSKLF